MSTPRPLTGAGPTTALIHGDASCDYAEVAARSIAPPIWPSSTYESPDDDIGALARSTRPDAFYSRYGNPTRTAAERLIADAERAETALLFASGMAALSTTALTFLGAGDAVVLQSVHYGGTSALFTELAPRLGIEPRIVSPGCLDEFAAAIDDRVKLVMLETPANPTLAITDLRAVANLANAVGAAVLVDNTVASPINQRPLELGAHLVMHSATKYLGGHSDLLAGAIAGPAALVERIWKTSVITGAAPGSLEAWLIARGMRTLTLRVARQNESALLIATELAERTDVDAVHYPGLPSHPQHALARQQMSGFGGLLSFVPAGGARRANAIRRRLRFFRHAASLGSVESLVVRPAAMLPAWAGDRMPGPVDPALLRLSIGIEECDDLVSDLRAALDSTA